MNPAELKNKFKALWKDTFRDSDAYVSLVFDSYFNPDLVAYEEMSGDIVAALLGVPYEFGVSIFADSPLSHSSVPVES